MALRNCIKDIKFANQVQIRRVHGDAISEVSCKAQCISNKHKI